MKLILTLLIFLSLQHSQAFDRVTTTVGALGDEQQIAIDGTRFWRISDSRFYLGGGLRLTSQWATGETFKTAPAELTRGESGPGAIFRKEKKSNIDDLNINHSHVTSLNVLFQVLYKIDDMWGLGFNIDVIGFSYGERRSGRYDPQTEDDQWPERVNARPTEFNLLLGDDNDRGSLNSEFYVTRALAGGWAVKLGLIHAFTEYKTNQRLRKDNDRFRRKNYLPSLGISKIF